MRRIIPFLMLAILSSACGSAAPAALAVNAPTPTTSATITIAQTGTPLPTPASAPTTGAPTRPIAPTASPVTIVQTPSPQSIAREPRLAITATPAQRFADDPDPMTAVSAPLRIVVPAIALDTQIVSVGLDTSGVPIVPDHDVGWYNLSAMPAQGENIVLWGHVLRFRNAPQIPAPFARLKELTPGALVTLYDQQKAPHIYRVTQQVKVLPTQVEYILPQGKEMLTLVSCIGTSVVVHGEVVDKSHRLITIAEPVLP